MLKKLLILGVLGGLIFILVGDIFLPKPYGNWSTQTRTTLNNSLVNAFNPKMKNPSYRRMNQVDDLEKAVRAKDNDQKK